MLLSDNNAICERVNWTEESKNKTISYDGGEAYTPESFCWEQVEEALPPTGMAASIQALDWWHGYIADYV
eukprot:650899-Karenia_brevis.AAC.1